jgi:thiol-disulfide isomerase/thioredoxin
MEKMLIKKFKSLKGLFTAKNLPRLIILLIILGVLYFINEKFLKEGMTNSNEITSDEIEEHVKSGTKLVLFYADWCGHCKKIKPVWEETSSEVNEKDKSDLKMIMVNCGEGTPADQKIMKKYSIDGYPTIIKFVEGKPQLYQGEREPESFKEALA